MYIFHNLYMFLWFEQTESVYEILKSICCFMSLCVQEARVFVSFCFCFCFYPSFAKWKCHSFLLLEFAKKRMIVPLRNTTTNNDACREFECDDEANNILCGGMNVNVMMKLTTFLVVA